MDSSRFQSLFSAFDFDSCKKTPKIINCKKALEHSKSAQKDQNTHSAQPTQRTKQMLSASRVYAPDPDDERFLSCGKYKGRTFADVLLSVPEYASWAVDINATGALEPFKKYVCRVRAGATAVHAPPQQYVPPRCTPSAFFAVSGSPQRSCIRPQPNRICSNESTFKSPAMATPSSPFFSIDDKSFNSRAIPVANLSSFPTVLEVEYAVACFFYLA